MMVMFARTIYKLLHLLWKKREGKIYICIHLMEPSFSPPKMADLGCPLREVVAGEGLDHIGSKFCLINIW